VLCGELVGQIGEDLQAEVDSAAARGRLGGALLYGLKRGPLPGATSRYTAPVVVTGPGLVKPTPRPRPQLGYRQLDRCRQAGEVE